MKRMIGSPIEIDPSVLHTVRLAEHSAICAILEAPDTRDGADHALIGGRQSGKTRLAKMWLMEPGHDNRVLVVLSEAIAADIMHDLALPRASRRVVSFRHLLHAGTRADAEYGIDESLAILERLLGIRNGIRLITVCTAADHQV